MANKKSESSKTAEMMFPGWENDARQIEKLAKALSAAVKSKAIGKPDFAKQIEEANRLAAQINWTEVRGNIEREAKGERDRNEANLGSRREKLLQAATAARMAVQQGSQFDLVDIFQVLYEGTAVAVKLGGVPFQRIAETDGEKVFAKLRQMRAGLDQVPFQRETFFKLLKRAHGICRQAQPGGEEFVPVRELHREMVFERARNSDRFRKTGEVKSIEDYPLPQFIYDLARLIRDGAVVGSERILTQTPAMRESKEMVHIPNLNNPTSSEATAARLAIRPA
ncbi:MAG: hypothetical protein FJ147_16145 [Deltaproteobacteria bacterium]|nr:hypothetical protein [Deltaproteobacteria bacterium]